MKPPPKRKGDHRVKEKVGVDFVAGMVNEYWLSGWQPFDHINDDGVDGLIILRKRGHDTGRIVFVQVKSGESYIKNVKQPTGIVRLKIPGVANSRAKWKRQPGPVVLVYVEGSPRGQVRRAWWTDLKDDASFERSPNFVRLPSTQRFGPHSKGDFIRLCGAGPRDSDVPSIEVTRAEISVYSLQKSVKHDARDQYKEWANSPAATRTIPELGVVGISRYGWRHITRRGRPRERILQSLLLLPVARKLVSTVHAASRLGPARVNKNIAGHHCVVSEFFGLRALVKFPHRDESLVQVVLLRKRWIGPTPRSQTWFCSVYELRRGAKK